MTGFATSVGQAAAYGLVYGVGGGLIGYLFDEAAHLVHGDQPSGSGTVPSVPTGPPALLGQSTQSVYISYPRAGSLAYLNTYPAIP